MELKSEPQYDTVQVTDIDIAFPGDLQAFTLRQGVDSFVYADEGNRLILTLGVGGQVTFNLVHAHWIAQRQRSIRVLRPEPKPVTE